MTFKQMWFMLDSNRDKAIDDAEWLKVDLFTAAINNSLLAFRAGADGKFTTAGIAWKAERALPESPSPLLYRDRPYTIKNGGVVLRATPPPTGKSIFRSPHRAPTARMTPRPWPETARYSLHP